MTSSENHFTKLSLGKHPQNYGKKIFIELLATPPPYASHDFARNPTKVKDSVTFVHIKASFHEVTLTCRQIYLEAHRVFFSSKAYYLGSPHEAKHFIKYRPRPVFRYETITALCLKGLVTYPPRFTKEQIDKICSDMTDYSGIRSFRKQLEAETIQDLNPKGFEYLFARLHSLKKVCLCMRVGEEMEYLSFLYGLTGLGKGLVEFVNASKWLIRPQHAEDVWRIQYSCFCDADYGVNKDDEEIPYALLQIEREITDIDARDPGLKDGDERYVEVEIQRVSRDPCLVPNSQDAHSMQHDRNSTPTTDGPLPVALSGDFNDTDSESDSNQTAGNLSDEEDQDQDQDTQSVGQQETINQKLLAESLNRDDDIMVFATEPIPIDQTSATRPLINDSSGLQSEKDTHQVEEPTIPEPVNARTSVTRSKINSTKTNDPSLPGSFPAPVYDESLEAENDQKIARQQTLLDADDDNRHAHTDTEVVDQAPQAAGSHNDELHVDIETEADQKKENLEGKEKGGVHLTSIEYLSSQKKTPLLEFVDTPNPYTQKEMESYYIWQSSVDALSRETVQKDLCQEDNIASGSTESQQHHKDPLMASRKQNSEGKRPLPASQNRPRLPSRSTQTGALSLLFLLLVIIALRPEWLSSARREEKGSSQQ